MDSHIILKKQWTDIKNFKDKEVKKRKLSQQVEDSIKIKISMEFQLQKLQETLLKERLKVVKLERRNLMR